MIVDLHDKSFSIFGLKGTGKSTFAAYLAEQFSSTCLLYDTLGEAPASAKYYTYVPRARNSVPELEVVIVNIKASKVFRLFLIDEANRYAPSKPAPLPANLADLNDQCRHYRLAVGYIARRPCQLNQDLTELSDYIFVFHVKGIRDVKYLNDLSAGLGEAVLNLDKFQFVIVYPDRSYRISNPIKASTEWLQSAHRHLTRN